MKASSPQDLSRLIIEALNSGDVDIVVSLYEPDGVIAPTRIRSCQGVRQFGH